MSEIIQMLKEVPPAKPETLPPCRDRWVGHAAYRTEGGLVLWYMTDPHESPAAAMLVMRHVLKDRIAVPGSIRVLEIPEPIYQEATQ